MVRPLTVSASSWIRLWRINSPTTEGTPPGEHEGELPDGSEPGAAEEDEQEHNAETTEDQPSQ